jgi:NAD-dependent SIR2 family protein deacetylase
MTYSDPALALARFIEGHQSIFVLTGAGCSTESGIPDYRDSAGQWKRKPPVTWQAFSGDEQIRSRYWARSMIGWRAFGQARPNSVHLALTTLEQSGKLSLLVTQNVDGLHQRAGHQSVVDLHGRLDTVVCLVCGSRTQRQRHQQRLEDLNPDWLKHSAAMAPDGDADLDAVDFSNFQIPDCQRCGGMLKPDVVFFGETVPRSRVELAMAALDRSDAMLVLGSSLMVYSGFRFARAAAERGIPIAAVNLGTTRADPLLSLKINAPCSQSLAPWTNPVAGQSHTSPA